MQNSFEKGQHAIVTHPIAEGRVYVFQKYGTGGDLLFSRPDEDEVCLVIAPDFTGIRPLEPR